MAYLEVEFGYGDLECTEDFGINRKWYVDIYTYEVFDEDGSSICVLNESDFDID